MNDLERAAAKRRVREAQAAVDEEQHLLNQDRAELNEALQSAGEAQAAVERLDFDVTIRRAGNGAVAGI